MEIFTELNIWNDLTPRSGAMNMAVDQLLLETISDLPVLRFYSWDKPSVSFGYFDSLASVRAIFHDEKLELIRRWTGGGIVDHRIDVTYTLAIPSSNHLAKLRGAESYRIIHQVIANALNAAGIECQLTLKHTGDGSATCFTNPVAYDIVTPKGKKLAGAGQKRTRNGLLHQGSIIGITDIPKWQKLLVQHLAESVIPWTPETTFFETADKLASTRYAQQKWTKKRH